VTHYTPDGELDFYKLWTDAQKRIHELEERNAQLQARALVEIEMWKEKAIEWMDKFNELDLKNSS